MKKLGESYKEFCAGYRDGKAWLGERGADRSDCSAFFKANRADLQAAHASGLSWSRLGHDFYLTRNATVPASGTRSRAARRRTRRSTA